MKNSDSTLSRCPSGSDSTRSSFSKCSRTVSRICVPHQRVSVGPAGAKFARTVRTFDSIRELDFLQPGVDVLNDVPAIHSALVREFEQVLPMPRRDLFCARLPSRASRRFRIFAVKATFPGVASILVRANVRLAEISGMSTIDRPLRSASTSLQIVGAAPGRAGKSGDTDRGA